MAYGMEVWIGWRGGKRIVPLLNLLGFTAERLGLVLNFEEGVDPEKEYMAALIESGAHHEMIDAHIKKRLKVAHKAALEAAGFTPLGQDDRGYDVYDTPLGKRTFGTWELALFHDEEEVGTDFDTCLFGVNLSSRYFPTFLDWENEHGTLEPAIVLNEKFVEMTGIARQALLDLSSMRDGQLAFFFKLMSEAQIMVMHRHY